MPRAKPAPQNGRSNLLRESSRGRRLRRTLFEFEPRLGHCHLRVSFNGRTAVLQTADAGSIPAARSEPIL